jgi:hypothetical protein
MMPDPMITKTHIQPIDLTSPFTPNTSVEWWMMLRCIHQGLLNYLNTNKGILKYLKRRLVGKKKGWTMIWWLSKRESTIFCKICGCHCMLISIGFTKPTLKNMRSSKEKYFKSTDSKIKYKYNAVAPSIFHLSQEGTMEAVAHWREAITKLYLKWRLETRSWKNTIFLIMFLNFRNNGFYLWMTFNEKLLFLISITMVTINLNNSNNCSMEWLRLSSNKFEEYMITAIFILEKSIQFYSNSKLKFWMKFMNNLHLMGSKLLFRDHLHKD